MSRKGYSIFRRKVKGRYVGGYYCAWTDGVGVRHVKVGGRSSGTAHEFGRAQAAEADRVRVGLMSPAEAKAKQSQREPVSLHTAAWKKAVIGKGRTDKYANQQESRVIYLLSLSTIESLDQLTAEKVQQALAEVAEEHSPNTANHYRTAMKSFCKWCVRNHRMLGSPMDAVDKLKERGDTFKRYAFSAEQLESLFTATEKRAHARSPFDGKDRAMFYRLMSQTGFRRSHAASLVLEDFQLDHDDQPLIRIRSAFVKNRKDSAQPITRAFAELLRPWLAGKEAEKPVFGISHRCNIERIFVRDCAAAGIVAPEGTILGCHSLRRFYITTVNRAAGLSVAQQLAGHSTPKLTAKYSDLTMSDYRKGLAGLPVVGEAKQEKRRTA